MVSCCVCLVMAGVLSGDSSARLPPLRVQEARGDAPRIMAPTQGANPLYTKEAIISMPEGGGYTPKQTAQGIISMPGDDHPHGATFSGPPRREQLQPANGKRWSSVSLWSTQKYCASCKYYQETM